MAVDLSPAARRALDSICDTFCPPPGDGLPSPAELRVTESLLEALERNPRRAEREALARLLSLWDTPLMTALSGGGLRRFSSLPQERRERILLSWCDSRIRQRRAVFQAFRKAALIFYWMASGPDGAANPAWERIGYPGPLGSLNTAAPKQLQPLALDGDEVTLECDVAIVGSGAGGGTAAGVLSEAGLDVIVIEAGGYYDDADFDGSEAGALTNLYLGAPQASDDQSVGLLAGSCLGGGTVVNYSTSFRTPEDVRSEWAGYGVSAFTGDGYTASLDAVVARLGVNSEHSTPSSRDRKMHEACAALGWHVDRMPRNVRGCDQGENCGYCGLGCRLGAKQSVVKTWLADAAQRGARLIVGARAERVLVSGGAARGVEARTRSGQRVTVRSRAVVSACGALHTPALLRRSGLRNPNIGRHLKLHPATVVWGVFDEQLDPWEGTLQALYSDQLANLDGGYGVKFETAPVHPHILLGFAPWRSARQSLELLGAMSHTTPMGVLLRDRDGGEVRVGRDGEPVVRYRLSDYDTRHLRAGVDGAARMLEEVGARRIYSSHAEWVAYDPGARGSREQFMRDADACGWGAGRCHLNSFHIMSSARMGGSPETSACNPRGETWDVKRLYVCDGSAFPTASGVNPMISIEAIAHMNARGIAAELA
jgi:long-chain-alcohol oxidase